MKVSCCQGLSGLPAIVRGDCLNRNVVRDMKVCPVMVSCYMPLLSMSPAIVRIKIEATLSGD